MILSIVVVNHNTKGLLKQCLDSLMKHPTKSSEMIVVDNASNDRSVGMIQRSFPNVRIITNRHNHGFGAANNQGAGVARGKYLLFLNPDTKVERDFDELLEYLEKAPKIGILGCRLVDETGKEQPHIAGFKHNVFSAVTDKVHPVIPNSFQDLGVGMLKRVQHDIRSNDTDWVTGACMLVRRKVFEELGGFDEQFFMYFEDEDLCLRAKENGWQVVHYPKFSVIHIGGASSENRKKWKHDRYFQSQDLFYKKHHGLVQNIVLKILRWPLRKFFRE